MERRPCRLGQKGHGMQTGFGHQYLPGQTAVGHQLGRLQDLLKAPSLALPIPPVLPTNKPWSFEGSCSLAAAAPESSERVRSVTPSEELLPPQWERRGWH